MSLVLAALAVLHSVSRLRRPTSLGPPTYTMRANVDVKVGSETREATVAKVAEGGAVEMIGLLFHCSTCRLQMNRGRSADFRVTNTVEGYEEVKTPAGIFEAYRIRRDWTLKDWSVVTPSGIRCVVRAGREAVREGELQLAPRTGCGTRLVSPEVMPTAYDERRWTMGPSAPIRLVAGF